MRQGATRLFWLCAALLATACTAATSPSRPAVLLSFRGGSDDVAAYDSSDDQQSSSSVEAASEGAGSTMAPSSSSAALAEYVEKLNTFMDTFESLVARASTTCKRSKFLGFTASAASVRQRPDRRALNTAHQQLREIYRDAMSLSEAEHRQHLFAATTLRLHVLLRLLLSEPSSAAPDVGASAGVCVPAELPPPPELVPPDELEALYALRGEMTKKPTGTLSEVVAELRKALEEPAAAHLSLLYSALLASASGGSAALPRVGDGAQRPSPVPSPFGEPLDGEEPTDGSAAGGEAGGGGGSAMAEEEMLELQREVAQALEMAEAAGLAQQQQQAEAERLIAEHANARRAAEAAAAEAVQKLAAIEAGGGAGGAAAAEAVEAAAAAAREREAKGEAQLGEAHASLAAAQAALAEASKGRDEAAAACDEARARAAEMEEKLRLSSQSAAQAAASEGAARGQAAQLAQQLQALEAQHAQLSSSHQKLEEASANHVALEAQVAHRIEALAALGRELPDGPDAPSVPLGQHREVQLELQMLHQRHADLQRQHAASMHHLGQARAEARAAAGHAAELQRRLEQAEAQLTAASAFQPPPRAVAPPAASAGGSPLGEEASAAAAAIVSQSTEAAKAVGGSLFGLLSKGAQKAQEISKSFIEDVSGLQGSGADAPAPSMPSGNAMPPQDDPGRRLV